jgi:hypothetical protein
MRCRCTSCRGAAANDAALPAAGVFIATAVARSGSMVAAAVTAAVAAMPASVALSTCCPFDSPLTLMANPASAVDPPPAAAVATAKDAPGPLPRPYPPCRRQNCSAQRLSPTAQRGPLPVVMTPRLPRPPCPILPAMTAAVPCAAGTDPTMPPKVFPPLLRKRSRPPPPRPTLLPLPPLLSPWAGSTPSLPSGYAKTIDGGATRRSRTTFHGFAAVAFVVTAMVVLAAAQQRVGEQRCPLALNCLGRLFFSTPALDEIRAKVQKHMRPKGHIQGS